MSEASTGEGISDEYLRINRNDPTVGPNSMSISQVVCVPAVSSQRGLRTHEL